MCPHGGQVTVNASASRLTVNGAPVVRVGDQHLVSGCQFNIAGLPQPCVRVVFTGGPGVSLRVTVQGQQIVLAQPGAGMCFDSFGQPKGPPLLLNSQTRVRGV